MIGRDVLGQVRRLIQPLQIRVANSIARAVVQLVDDGRKLQELQLGVLEGEDLDEAERFQEYGFSSVPLAGAEAVVIFPNGDRAHPLVVAVDDRRYRPVGGDPGDVFVYGYEGARVTMKANGDVEINPAAGGQVYIRSEGGVAEPLVRLSEFNAHEHLVSTTGGPAAQTGTAAPIDPPATGTGKVRAE